MKIIVRGQDGDSAEDLATFAQELDEAIAAFGGDYPIEVELPAALKEREALDHAIERLEALGVPSDARVYVDDENRTPSYARYYWSESDGFDRRGLRLGNDLDDEELDEAVAWLPRGSFLIDKSEGPYNPFTTINHLRGLK